LDYGVKYQSINSHSVVYLCNGVKNIPHVYRFCYDRVSDNTNSVPTVKIKETELISWAQLQSITKGTIILTAKW